MIFGHEGNQYFFEKAVKDNDLNHAYLFYGDPEIGKFHFAKHLAYFLEYGRFEQVNKPLLDTVFVGPGEKGSVGIDEVRDLKLYLNQRPLNSNKRLIVVNDAENLTPEAQNSFLKFLEEPPEHIVFVFIVSNPDSLLSTVVSRMTKIYFRRQPKEVIENVLIKEMKTTKDRAHKLASLSFGRLGRAMKLLIGKDVNSEPNLKNEIEENILDLYIKDKIDNHLKIKELLIKEQEVYTNNLNENLQRKATEEIMRTNPTSGR